MRTRYGVASCIRTIIIVAACGIALVANAPACSAQAAPPVGYREVAHPRVPLPLQPFTLELLDLERGRWAFGDAFGQRLQLPETVTAWAYTAAAPARCKLAYLCCDPEYPESLDHAVLRIVDPSPAARGTSFRIDEPFFSATVTLDAATGGTMRCRLSSVRFGPATAGDRYVAALYVMVGNRACPVWLASGDGPGLRMLTGRIGGVFKGAEPVGVTLAALGGMPAGTRVDLEARDYARGDVVWRGAALTTTGTPGVRIVTLPLARYGVFEITARAGPDAELVRLRICRIPSPRPVDPNASHIGINLFQQQIWWYAHQAPLLAAAGVHWIRPWLAWENTWASQQPARDRWEMRPLDASVRRMERLGLRYQSILYAAPSWLTGGDSVAPPPDRMEDWSRYVERLTRRYRGRIPAYEMWNEPDLMWPEATRHAGAHYVSLLKAGYAAAKRGDPRCTVLGLSHAGYEEWLDRVGALNPGPYMDVATIHTYADPDGFLAAVDRRKEILRRHGMGGKPLWVNEFGVTADDLNPAYSREYACSERRQAEVLVENYAQALSVSPGAKAFWFCSLDPRDPAHKDQWTGDAGIGVLYLGLLPKLAYPALAGVAHELDGHDCIGAVEVQPGVRMVAFRGPVAVVWAEALAGLSSMPAVRLGCAPGERIVVRDSLANKIANGPAARVRLDFAHGPLYIEGCPQLEAVVRAEAGGRPARLQVQPSPGRAAVIPLRVPATAAVTTRIVPDLRVKATAHRSPGGWRIAISPLPGVTRTHGVVRVSVRFPAGAYGLSAPRTVTTAVSVTAGEPNLIRDGSFLAGGVSEWAPERSSPYAFDPAEGHSAPGCLRVDGPFDRRLVHWDANPVPGRTMKLRCWVKTRALSGCRATLSLALFGEKGWLRTWCLASTEPSRDDDATWRPVLRCARIPGGNSDWTLLEAELPADKLPQEVRRAAFLLDVSGGGAGTLWLDDLDLWQPGD